jgi:hypothetical protein
MSAKDRPFARFAAEICYGKTGLNALDNGHCPMCGQPAIEFRDSLSRKEFGISGMCQACQDTVFRSHDD